MLSLAVDLAIFRRLVGWPLDSQARPVVDSVTKIPVNRLLPGPPRLNGEFQPSYGVRLSSARFDLKKFDLKSSSPDAVKVYEAGFYPNSFTQVPVFWEGTNGRDWESIFPCVIFSETGMMPSDIFVAYDDIVVPDPAAGTNTLPDGTVVPAGYLVSPHPEQRIITYAIKVFAKNRVEMALVCEQVERLFPQRTALLVDRADGSTLPFDMIRYSEDDLSYRTGDKDRSLAGDERFYGKAYNYKVEAYADFETGAFGDQFSQQHESTILSYVMELVQTQSLLVQHLDGETAAPTP